MPRRLQGRTVCHAGCGVAAAVKKVIFTTACIALCREFCIFVQIKQTLKPIGTMNGMKYKVTKANLVRNVTAGVWVVVFAVSVVACNAIPARLVSVTSVVVMLLAALSVFAILLYFFLISPRSVELTADALVLHRVSGRKVFRYADIAEAGLWTGKPSSLLRLCGSGAFCGYIGWFSGGGLGAHFEYVGNYADAFYLKLRSGRTYLLSCDGAEHVVESVCEGVQGKER